MKRTRHAVERLAAGAVLGWGILAGAASRTHGATWDVAIENFAFVPANLAIRVGDTVRWTQKDADVHTTTSGPNGVADGLWDSGNMTLGANSTFSFTFDAAGTYPYFCRPHSEFMRATITVNAPAPTPATLSEIELVGALGVKIAWTGGNPPYLLQQKAALEDSGWTDVATTDDPAIIVARDTDMAFYRVAGPTDRTVTPLTVWMSGPAERPSPVDTAGTGFGTVAVSGNSLRVNVTFSGLSGNATAAHIHGIATTSESTGVLIPLQVPATSAGRITGTYDLSGLTAEQRHALVHGETYLNIHTADYETAAGVLQPLVPEGAPGASGAFSGTLTLTLNQLAAVADGLTYVNVHTATHPGGEVRGQVASSHHE